MVSDSAERLELMSDEQLVSLSREGNLQAFNSLAARWESSLYRFVRRTIGNAEEARDVCQESLTKAFQNIERLREGEKFKAWIHHIALNLCRDRFRSLKSRTDVRSLDDVSDEELHIASSDARPAPPDVRVQRADLHQLLGRVLEKIPVEQRSAIVLREYHGFNSEEIGEITGVPAATVRTRIFYGLKSLRRELADRGITGPEFLEGDEIQ